MSRRKARKVTLYMMVTRDKYELPLYVTESAAELAKYAGTTANSVHSSIHHARARKGNSAFKKVEVTL